MTSDGALSELERDEFPDAQSGLQILPKLHELLDLQRVPRLIPNGASPLISIDELERLERARGAETCQQE